MKKILYIDACINRDSSRTESLAQAYLHKRLARGDCQLQSVILEEVIPKSLTAELLSERESAINAGDFTGRLFDFARSFAAADEVVIAAPYWDMSFPAVVKLYIEQLCVRNLTFRYGDNGMPCGLTNVKSAVYLTTAGGYIGGNNFGFEYIKGVFSTLFGIDEFYFFSAEGLDIFGNDPQKLLADAVKEIDGHFDCQK